MGEGQAARTETMEVRVTGMDDVTALAAREPAVRVLCHGPEGVLQNAERTANDFLHRTTLRRSIFGGGPGGTNKPVYWGAPS